MRVLTRLTAAVVTAGALIAPATMPAAHAATVQSVTHVGAVTPGMFVPEQGGVTGPYELQPGQTLTIRNLYVDVLGAQTYTIRNEATGVASRTIAFGETDALTVPPKSGSTYVLTATPSGASFTFFAL